MRKMNRFIPVALACAIFAAQPVQAATIIRDSDKQATSQNKQTTNTTQNPQAGNEGGPGYEDSKPNTSNNTTNTTGQLIAEQEAQRRHKRLKAAEIHADSQHMLCADLFNRKALTYGNRKGIHAKRNADKKYVYNIQSSSPYSFI